MNPRKLKLADGIWLVTGSMIGSGIFIVSADIARNLGGGGWMLLAWLVAGIITIMGALSYGELAGMMPHAGGQYVYLRQTWGPLSGFLYGWTLFTVIQTGTIAAVAMAFAKYTAVLIPALSETKVALDLGFLTISPAQLLAIASIILLSWFNSTGVQRGSSLQKIFTLSKLLALLALIVAGFLYFDTGIWHENLTHFWDHQAWQKNGDSWSAVEPAGMAFLAAFGASMVGTLFSHDAWNNVTFVSGEMEKPERNVALSMVMGTLVVTCIYLLANVVYLGHLPFFGDPAASGIMEKGIQFAAQDRVGTAAAHHILGDDALFVMAILIMVSTFGCNNGVILSGARVYHVMARDGLFFPAAAKLNEKNVPGNSLWAQCIWASILCLSGKYGDLLDYVMFAVLLFYILTVGAVFLMRVRMPNADRPYRTLGYPVVPALYGLLAAGICIILLWKKPLYTWPGLGIVLLGIPVYYIAKNFFRKQDAGAPQG